MVSDPDVVKILREVHPKKESTGIYIIFYRFIRYGKSTIANGVITKLHELTNKPITLLDGDEVKNFLSSELGFSDEDRNLNIKRIGYVASEVNKARGIVVCAAIAPFAKSREEARKLVENKGGNFIEIFIDVNLEICEKRDRKGLYKKARDGVIKKFTGIDSPYEKPIDPEIVIDSNNLSSSQSINKIMDYIKSNNYI